ncbi:UNKNOWN [Stylonychia lemnae]|uniref:Uncharacterized protein n=1 Tax=Stylonychia lemnae TaxID=5949 RepID=A0A078BAX4_STYLE|nr:UNKNOWN [Stylonychia lemnae]|eukprot:CDW90723.1 UNKNOWN [Stylonychia lemnae]
MTQNNQSTVILMPFQSKNKTPNQLNPFQYEQNTKALSYLMNCKSLGIANQYLRKLRRLKKSKKEQIITKRRLKNFTSQFATQNSSLQVNKDRGFNGQVDKENISLNMQHLYKAEFDNILKSYLQPKSNHDLVSDFNKAVQMNANFDILSDILDNIRQNLPRSIDELMLAFTFIHQEGLAISISQILNKLQSQIYHPLLVRSFQYQFNIKANILWFMEDICGAGEIQEKDILQANIIGRVSSIFQVVINAIQRAQINENEIKYLGSIICSCLTMLSNLACYNGKCRKFNILGQFSQILNFSMITSNETFIDIASWFLHAVTQTFDVQFSRQVDSDLLIPFIVKLLYLPQNTKNDADATENALECILNLTDAQGNAQCVRRFAEYDQKCGLQDNYQLFSWIYNSTKRMYLAQWSSKAFERMRKILTIVNNLLSSDEEGDIQFFLEMGLRSFIAEFLNWNNPSALHFCSEFDVQICEILNNLVCSTSFSHGQQIFEDQTVPGLEPQAILDRYARYITCNDVKLRKESILLFANLLMYVGQEYKAALINNYEMIPQILQLLMNEQNASIIRLGVELIEYCLVRDTKNYDCDDESVEPQNVDMSYLQIFNAYNGIDILVDLRDKFYHNRDINDQISRFEQKFFRLDENDIYLSQINQTSQVQCNQNFNI